MKNLYKIVSIAILFTACQNAVLKIEKVPENTPPEAQIYVTGNFNRWDPGDSRYLMQKLPDNTYIIKLPLTVGRVEYKFTRGNWSTTETNRCGNDIENHFFTVYDPDTIKHTIESWSDLDALNCDSVTIVLEKIPMNTPVGDSIRIAGSFNAWNPGNRDEFLLKMDPIVKKYVVTVPRISINKTNLLNYKFVRGDINSPEADKFGREMDPRVLDFSKGDSIFVSIDNWAGLVNPVLNQVTIVISKIPINTPPNESIFLTGNFNNWNPADLKYIFQKNNSGLYQVSIPREKYGLAFKITRGTWNSEFVSDCGNVLSNQEYNYDEIDTVYVEIEGWKDIPKISKPEVVLVLNRLPENTPANSDIVLDVHELRAGRKLDGLSFVKQSDGSFQLKINRRKLNQEYVVTRGSYLSQEVNDDGSFISPRYFKDDCSDTLFLEVAAWNDLLVKTDKMVTLVVEYWPKVVGQKESIYITGKFNGWDPGDESFKLKLNAQNKFSIQISQRYLSQGFKFTMGSWNLVEGDSEGKYLENRIYKGKEETLYVRFENFEKR